MLRSWKFCIVTPLKFKNKEFLYNLRNIFSLTSRHTFEKWTAAVCWITSCLQTVDLWGIEMLQVFPQWTRHFRLRRMKDEKRKNHDASEKILVVIVKNFWNIWWQKSRTNVISVFENQMSTKIRLMVWNKKILQFSSYKSL